MIPIWFFASRRVNRSLRTKQVPMLAFGTAFTFVIMMFNIPAPGGTTGHAVGGSILAISLGPWAATIGITVALAIQALLFGDGGITALGANCFNMAFILPLAGYCTYKAISYKADISSPRRWIAAGIAGYVSINAAAFLTGFELGIQPILHQTPSGQPLYAPYPLSITIPAMAIEHLALFGVIEAIITGLVISYLQKTAPSMLTPSLPIKVPAPLQSINQQRMEGLKKLWIILATLVILTPVGLLAEGSAWGEWSPEELKVLIGYIPEGLRSLSSLWGGILGDYQVPGWKEPMGSYLGYIASAVIGVMITASMFLVLRRVGSSKVDRS